MDASVDDEPTPNVQVFKLRKMVLDGQDDADYDAWHRQHLVVTAFEKGYGLLEHPKKTRRQLPYVDEATFEIEFCALGVKLHG